ncbi:MAG: hypothetical protein L6264_07455 [Weeksellaceae bacterium]|uniref:Uncharacterized protein n=1 Tax=Kaistella haifensis DSM 19056 TaxID=1450526 RepID=A0A246B6R6_9FLAO|nr:hypothetical protein [Kaistella haifensis]MBU4536957.1 hypothetical protein [Bacteroidota bacterium]MCG2780770.1 hypothetical protein [Weeksellaceae bacterium]OWK97075.1 hypothetical protein AP75_13160 [Kaistella haifensis DSM 19056]
MTENHDERFLQLTVALQYDSYGEKYLTDFDRMLIHQNRSALLNGKDYQLPDTVEEKMTTKLNYITKHSWVSPF